MGATGEDGEAFGVDHAEHLLKAGWGQGSVFRPNDHVPIPAHLAAWPEDIWLVVCTQACGVVSPDIVRDPHVEIALAKAITKFSVRSPDATGKNVRRFHMPVTGAAFAALDVDVNTRFFTPRRALLLFDPDPEVRADVTATRNLAGWLGRHYTRIALPNELVRRLVPSFFRDLGRYLSERSGPDATGEAPRVHDAVSAIFVKWSPDRELRPDEPYDVEVLAICDDPAVSETLDRRAADVGRVEAGGDVTISMTVQGRDETALSDIDGWVRLTEWDYLTGMAEAAALPG